MTIHIYKARLLHYLTESDRTERATSDHSQTLIAEQDIALLPVIEGVQVYPEYIADGALVVDDMTGCIVEYGHNETILTKYVNTTEQAGQLVVKVHDYRDKLIMPGFIDTHVHYPQIDMIAAYGELVSEIVSNAARTNSKSTLWS